MVISILIKLQHIKEALDGVFGRWEIGQKMGDLGDWATNKLGDGRFGSKMGAGTGISVKCGRLEDSNPPALRASSKVKNEVWPS